MKQSMEAMSLLVDEYMDGNSEIDNLQGTAGDMSIDNGPGNRVKRQAKPITQAGRQQSTQEAIFLREEALGEFPDLVVAASPNQKQVRATRKQSIIHEANKRK